MHDLGGFGVGANRFDVPHDAAVLRVDAERAERNVARLGGAGGGREIDLAVDQHGRRPAAAGNRLLPGDVLRRAPLDGNVRRGRNPVARRPAKLRPIGSHGERR